MESLIASMFLLAGIVAKGLGAIAILFGIGVVVGVVLTLLVTSKVRNLRNR